MSVLDHHIDLAIEKETFVDIYRDHIDEETIFGKINSHSQYFLYMTRYNEDGEYDGISIFRKEDISRIRWQGRERLALARLVKQNSLPPSLPNINIFHYSMLPMLEEFSIFAAIAIYTEDIDPEMCFVGEIVEMDEEHLVMHEYGPLNSMDRSFLLLKLDEITRIDADDRYLRNLVSLHKVNV